MVIEMVYWALSKMNHQIQGLLQYTKDAYFKKWKEKLLHELWLIGVPVIYLNAEDVGLILQVCNAAYSFVESEVGAKFDRALKHLLDLINKRIDKWNWDPM